MAEAAETLELLRSEAELPPGLWPFASDGLGNHLVTDASGRILDWDHETRETRSIASSLANLLGTTRMALHAGKLFGGSERKPGEVDPRLERARSLLKKPRENVSKICEVAYALAPGERYQILCELRRALGIGVPAGSKQRLFGSLANAAAAVRDWDAAAEALELGDVPAHTWVAVGCVALEHGGYALAARALAKDDLGGEESGVGVAVATWRLRGEARTEIEAVERKLSHQIAEMDAQNAEDIAAGKALNASVQRYLAALLVLRAALAQAAGDDTAARVALARARETWREVDLGVVGRAAGLADDGVS